MVNDGQEMIDGIAEPLFDLLLVCRINLVSFKVCQQGRQEVLLKCTICTRLPPVINCQGHKNANHDNNELKSESPPHCGSVF